MKELNGTIKQFAKSQCWSVCKGLTTPPSNGFLQPGHQKLLVNCEEMGDLKRVQLARLPQPLPSI